MSGPRPGLPRQAAILAGGRATRLGELARATPKSLLDVAGRPFLLRQLDLLGASGIRRVVLCLGHLGEAVEAALAGGAAAGLEVRISRDEPGRPAGTGGALARALPLMDESFYVLYGDSYLPVDYRPAGAAFAAAGLPALMAVYQNSGEYEASNAVFDEAAGRVTAYGKRPPPAGARWIDYGLGVFSRVALAPWAQAPPPLDLAEIYGRLAAAGQLAGWAAPERFYEIGSPAGLAELRRLLAGGETAGNLFAALHGEKSARAKPRAKPKRNGPRSYGFAGH